MERKGQRLCSAAGNRNRGEGRGRCDAEPENLVTGEDAHVLEFDGPRNVEQLTFDTHPEDIIRQQPIGA
ncbi:MAG TPA: hypothetical protein VGO49_21215 [Bradyrhizobium sp.]|nr:hypothetical protein [Bradyrhizobium sp.]